MSSVTGALMLDFQFGRIVFHLLQAPPNLVLFIIEPAVLAYGVENRIMCWPPGNCRHSKRRQRGCAGYKCPRRDNMDVVVILSSIGL